MIILGVDGGGTKTHALALDEYGNILGSGTGGRSNYHTIGLASALDALADVTQQALSGLNGQQADIAIYCLGACDSAVDEERLTDGLSNLNRSKRLICYNDSFAALRAGSTRPYGVVVICGTGFNAGGIAPDGRQARLYSLGTLTGDWGGGYSIGEAIFAAVFRADDWRGEATMLTEMLLKALDFPDLTHLAQAISEHRFTPPQIGSLAPLAFEAAEAGDVVAQGIIRRQADEIVVAAGAMLRRLEMTDLDVDVILSGGVTKGRGTLLLDSTREQLASDYPKALVHSLDMPPVIGAVCLGFDAVGIPAPSPQTLRDLSRHLVVPTSG
jgi:N-acetylglucosamine kinase-like BadF-type ATPase